MTTAKRGASKRAASPAEPSGPDPRGRTTVPLRVTITRAQQAAVRARAEEQGCTVDEIVRRFIADGLAGLAAPGPAKADDADG
jgi:hypothetical protein